MARPKATDLPGMNGPGVAPPRYKELDRLADKFIDVRDAKAELATQLGKIETQIAEAMQEHGIKRYQFSDQEIVIKEGKVHVKVKTVKVEGARKGEDPTPED